MLLRAAHRRLGFCILALLAMLLVAGPPAPAATPKSGGHLRYGQDSEPPSIDPHLFPSATAARNSIHLIYSGLVRFGPGATVLPELAEKWDISADGKLYTFHLRKGVKFHNGDDFTSEDVKASFERILNPQKPGSFRSQLSSIDKVEAVDRYTVRVTLKGPSATFLGYLAKAEATIAPAKLAHSNHDFNSQPVGTGPFKFAEREPGVRIKLVKNPDYWEKGKPYLDSITFLPLPNDQTRVNALRSGEVDMIGYVPWKDMDAFEKDQSFVLTKTAGPYMCLMYNVSRKPFDNPKVRQAVGYAIDRQAIIEVAFFGRGSPITGGLLPEGTTWYNSQLKDTFKLDVAKAKALIQEAGYGGGLPPVKFMTSSTHAMHYQTAEVVQAELKKNLGWNVTLDRAEWPVTVQRGASGDFDFRVHGLGADLIDPDLYTNHFTSGSTFYAKPTGFRDDQIDRLLLEGRTTLAVGKRKEIYAQLERRILDLSPWSYLTRRVQGNAATKHVKGYQHLPGWLVFDAGIFLRDIWLDK